MTTSDPRHYDIILSPVITEKATNASSQDKVIFKVAMDASKPQIKEAVDRVEVHTFDFVTLSKTGRAVSSTRQVCLRAVWRRRCARSIFSSASPSAARAR